MTQIQQSILFAQNQDEGGSILAIIYLLLVVAAIVGLWKTFTKAGKPGWGAIIPIYNAILLLQIAGRPIWWILLFIIPIVNFVVAIVVGIDVAKNFGKGAGFGIGLALLGFIFYPILGFGDAKYRPVAPLTRGEDDGCAALLRGRNAWSMRIAFFLYGLVAYLLFFAAILLGIGFVGNLDGAPKGIDGGVVGPLPAAIVVNVSLLLLFAVQHNIMARPWFKDWWVRFVPRPIERSTYVAAASLILLLLYWQWRPMPNVVWNVDNEIGRGVLSALYFVGWATVFYSSFVIDHFELFGLKQVWLHLKGRELVFAPFSERSIYRWVRHPLMLGFIVAFWSAPTMSQGRLLFAFVTTLWILIAIQIEERDFGALSRRAVSSISTSHTHAGAVAAIATEP